MRRMRMDSLLVLVLLACGLLFTSAVQAHEPMLPLVDDGKNDVGGWWMSEKLDGVRGYWNGHNLYSKHGVPLHPPRAFVADLPPFPLEGELWGGRGTFETTAGITRREQPDAAWLQLRFAIFDVPDEPGSFRQRIRKARHWFDIHPSPYAFVIEQTPLRSRQQLQSQLERIERHGGEGLIIRDPDASYTAGRSASILKVKSYQDAEATVIAHLPGQGRNAGRMGALLVREADGTEFKIGSGFSDAERDNPPPVGAVITFKYYGRYTSGLPRFPSYLRPRTDRGL